MIIDDLSKFCQDEAASGTAATRLEGDVIDLRSTGRNVSEGTPVYCVVVVETAFASAGAATVEFIVASDAQAAIATDGSATRHATTGPVAVADLTLGKRFVVPLGMGNNFERFLGLLVTTATATTTAGAITAFLTPDPLSTWRAYPEGDS